MASMDRGTQWVICRASGPEHAPARAGLASSCTPLPLSSLSSVPHAPGCPTFMHGSMGRKNLVCTWAGTQGTRAEACQLA